MNTIEYQVGPPLEKTKVVSMSWWENGGPQIYGDKMTHFVICPLLSPSLLRATPA
jgi:hypothetical protein